MDDIGVLVCTANDTFEAARIVSLLRDEGIPAYTKERGAGQVFRIYTGFSNMGTEIYVPAAAADRAQELIADAQEDPDTEEGPDEAEEDTDKENERT